MVVAIKLNWLHWNSVRLARYSRVTSDAIPTSPFHYGRYAEFLPPGGTTSGEIYIIDRHTWNTVIVISHISFLFVPQIPYFPPRWSAQRRYLLDYNTSLNGIIKRNWTHFVATVVGFTVITCWYLEEPYDIMRNFSKRLNYFIHLMWFACTRHQRV